MSDFIDQAKLDKLTAKIEDALRDLGLSVIPEATAFSVQGGQLVFQTAALVRDSASLEQDDSSNEEFLKMMAANAEAKVEEETSKITEAFADPEAFKRLLFDEDDDCEHDWHPDGFCKLCHKGIDA